MKPEDDTQVTISLASLQGLVDEIKRLRSPASALDAASAKPECEHEKVTAYAGGMIAVCHKCGADPRAPAAPEKPACEHAWSRWWESRDESGRITEWADKCSKCNAERRGDAPAPSSPAAERTETHVGIDLGCDPMRYEAWKIKGGTAERADEGLDADAHALRQAWYGDEKVWPQDVTDPWRNVARVARALRRGGVTADLLREANDLYGKFDLASEHGSKLRLDLSERIEAHLAALDSGASVVVDREELKRLKLAESHCYTLTVERASLAAKLAEAEQGFGSIHAACADRMAWARKFGAEGGAAPCDFGTAIRAVHALLDQHESARAEAERLRGERDEAMRRGAP